jgi:hypothetical protein
MNYSTPMICPECGGVHPTYTYGCPYRHTSPQPATPYINYGWMCPRCNRVHGPFVRQCDCPPISTVGNSSTSWKVTE